MKHYIILILVSTVFSQHVFDSHETVGTRISATYSDIDGGYGFAFDWSIILFSFFDDGVKLGAFEKTPGIGRDNVYSLKR